MSYSLICCAQYCDENWQWFAPSFEKNKIQWFFYYAKPNGRIEKLIRLPNLAAIRASFQAVQAAEKKQADLLFTHGPAVSYWCALLMRQFDAQVEHIAYAFNFPILPQGIKRRLMTFAFTNINKFIVYSTLEKQLYHDYFNIPLERIEVCFWSVNVPEFYPKEPIEAGNYICAIGGNARDYKTLMAAMEKLPSIKLVLVARPDNLKNLSIPSNVKVLVNIPTNQAMNILKFSRFMVLPLRDSIVPCGHVTLVAAMQLGKGFIITNSQGVKDYVIDGYNAILSEANMPDNLAKAIQELWNNPQKCKQIGKNGQDFANKYCSETSAKQQLQNYLLEKGLIESKN